MTKTGKFQNLKTPAGIKKIYEKNICVWPKKNLQFFSNRQTE